MKTLNEAMETLREKDVLRVPEDVGTEEGHQQYLNVVGEVNSDSFWGEKAKELEELRDKLKEIRADIREKLKTVKEERGLKYYKSYVYSDLSKAVNGMNNAIRSLRDE